MVELQRYFHYNINTMQQPEPNAVDLGAWSPHIDPFALSNGRSIAALVEAGYLAKAPPPTSSLHMQRMGRVQRISHLADQQQARATGNPEAVAHALEVMHARRAGKTTAVARALEASPNPHHLYFVAKAAALGAARVIGHAPTPRPWTLNRRHAPTFTPLPGARVRTPGLDDGSPL